MKKKFTLIIGFFISLTISSMVCMLYKYDNEIVKQVNISGVKIDIPQEYKYYLDSVNIENGQLNIRGWVTKTGQNLDYLNRKVALTDENGQIYEMNTLVENRPEVTRAIGDGFNYDNSGIIAQCPIKQFKKGQQFKIGYIVNEDNGDRYYIPFDKVITIGEDIK